MRVLHVFKTYWPDTFGGIERTIHAICTATADLGVDSTVLSLTPQGGADQIVLDHHRIVRATRHLDIASTPISFSAFGLFSRLSREADLVHYHFPWPYMDLAHLWARHRKPSIVTYHSDVVRQKFLDVLYAPVRDRFLRDVDVIVATSPQYSQNSITLRKFADKLEVIPVGLEEPSLADGTVDTTPEYPFFLFVGVLRYYKGLEVLIDASEQCDIPVLIAGSGPWEKLLHAHAKKKPQANVVFLGEVTEDQKYALLQKCVAFVFPSNLRSEAFGLSLVEAAMMGKAMISCEIGTGTSFVNLHGVTGLVVSPDDPLGLAEAMNDLSRNAEVRARFGVAARKRYEEKFTSTAMGRSYHELYQRLFRS